MLTLVRSHRIIEYALLVLGCLIPALLFITTFQHIAPWIFLGFAFAVVIIYAGAHFPGSFILLYIASAATFFENEPGVQPIELPFYTLTVLLSGYLLFQLLRGDVKIETSLDKLFLFLLLLIPYGVITGLIHGASIYKAFGETTYFFGVLAYFPLRQHLNRGNFTRLLQGIVLLFVAYVLIRNLINYRQLLIQAVLPWQAENARAAANEFIIMFGACLFMSAAAITTSRIRQIVFTACFILLIGGLVLTQSRGYWLAFFVGALIIFFVIDKDGKKRILLTFLVVGSSALAIALVFFGDLFSIVSNALIERFQSIGTGKLDVSLQERFLESKTVFQLMLQNPIAGYGIGFEYTKKLLVDDFFIQASYVHNGYLAAWLKFGILGLFAFLALWFTCIRNAIRIYRHPNSSLIVKIIALTITGTISGVLLVNNTSPQVLTFESILFLALFGAYLSQHITNLETR